MGIRLKTPQLKEVVTGYRMVQFTSAAPNSPPSFVCTKLLANVTFDNFLLLLSGYSYQFCCFEVYTSKEKLGEKLAGLT